MSTPDPNKTNELMVQMYDEIEKEHPDWTPGQIADEVARITVDEIAKASDE